MSRNGQVTAIGMQMPVVVPFQDLSRLHASIRSELDAALEQVIGSSAFVSGTAVATFERAFGAAHDTGPGAACGSGTDALALALRALGIGPGDEVVVPAMTFVATAEAVTHVGATPVVADVDALSLLLHPAGVDAVRTERTRAVIPVHLYGHPVPFEHLQHWKREGLVVVEDSAQAHLAHWHGDAIGTVGDAACFSFYPGKNLGAFGDGGMVLSRDPEVIDRVRFLRDHGRTTKYRHDEAGWCSRLDGLQAAVLSVKLRHLAHWTDSRRMLAARYRERLGGLLVPWSAGSVHHLLVARVPNRDRVQRALADHGVATGVHYPLALSQQPWLARTAPACREAERAAGEVLSLPMDPLLSLPDVDLVCGAFLAAVHEEEMPTA